MRSLLCDDPVMESIIQEDSKYEGGNRITLQIIPPLQAQILKTTQKRRMASRYKY
jgi:hypothetical protein